MKKKGLTGDREPLIDLLALKGYVTKSNTLRLWDSVYNDKEKDKSCVEHIRNEEDINQRYKWRLEYKKKWLKDFEKFILCAEKKIFKL